MLLQNCQFVSLSVNNCLNWLKRCEKWSDKICRRFLRKKTAHLADNKVHICFNCTSLEVVKSGPGSATQTKTSWDASLRRVKSKIMTSSKTKNDDCCRFPENDPDVWVEWSVRKDFLLPKSVWLVWRKKGCQFLSHKTAGKMHFSFLLALMPVWLLLVVLVLPRN